MLIFAMYLRVSPLSELLRHFSCGLSALLETMIFADDEKKNPVAVTFVNKVILLAMTRSASLAQSRCQIHSIYIIGFLGHVFDYESTSISLLSSSVR